MNDDDDDEWWDKKVLWFRSNLAHLKYMVNKFFVCGHFVIMTSLPPYRTTESKRFFDFDETLHTFKPTQVNFFNFGKFVTSLKNRKKIHFEVRNLANFGPTVVGGFRQIWHSSRAWEMIFSYVLHFVTSLKNRKKIHFEVRNFMFKNTHEERSFSIFLRFFWFKNTHEERPFFWFFWLFGLNSPQVAGLFSMFSEQFIKDFPNKKAAARPTEREIPPHLVLHVLCWNSTPASLARALFFIVSSEQFIKEFTNILGNTHCNVALLHSSRPLMVSYLPTYLPPSRTKNVLWFRWNFAHF